MWGSVLRTFVGLGRSRALVGRGIPHERSEPHEPGSGEPHERSEPRETPYFICTVRSVALPAVTVILCGALFSDSCQRRSS